MMMADKKTTLGNQEPETKPVIDLLTSILNEFQKQVQGKTPKSLDGEALRAVEQFREIGAALALQPRPTVELVANPTQLGSNGGTVRLAWTSTDTQTVSIDQKVGDVTTSLGEVTPAAGGFKDVNVTATTTFTATAKGPCASATDTATVTVSNLT
jgi:hypothetical protein